MVRCPEGIRPIHAGVPERKTASIISHAFREPISAPMRRACGILLTPAAEFMRPADS